MWRQQPLTESTQHSHTKTHTRAHKQLVASSCPPHCELVPPIVAATAYVAVDNNDADAGAGIEYTLVWYSLSAGSLAHHCSYQDHHHYY